MYEQINLNNWLDCFFFFTSMSFVFCLSYCILGCFIYIFGYFLFFSYPLNIRICFRTTHNGGKRQCDRMFCDPVLETGEFWFGFDWHLANPILIKWIIRNSRSRSQMVHILLHRLTQIESFEEHTHCKAISFYSSAFSTKVKWTTICLIRRVNETWRGKKHRYTCLLM